jgi:8-oxo-dGTP diphosphatase
LRRILRNINYMAKNPRLTVDLVIFALHQEELSVLLVKRQQAPFAHHWTLPATEVDTQQDVNLEYTVKRKLKELTALETPYVEQVQTLGNQNRDPRGWSVTVVYYSLVSHADPKMHWTPLKAALKMPLAFDHQQIIESALQRFQNKALYTSLPIFLLPAEFTLTELQKAYEAVLGFKMEKKSFRRRLQDAGFLQETGNIRRAKHWPASLYRLTHLQPYYFARIIEGVRESRDLD